jgi:hypothetical protein
VRIPAIREGKPWPDAMRAKDRTAWVEARDGFWEPLAQWTRPGTRLAFRSHIAGDVSVHVYRGAADVTIANFALRPGGEVTDRVVLDAPAQYLVRSDVDHEGRFHASAWAVESPYADVTSAEERADRKAGEFRLDDVPVGDHEVVAWHAGLRLLPKTEQRPWRTWSPDVSVRRRVRVRAGEISWVDFEMRD